MNKPAATMAELWAKASEDSDFVFQLKAQDVAVTLARAVAEAGLTQAQLAKKLGWKPSRVSHVLSGAGNLTLRTLFDICTVLGFELDVVLRAPHVMTLAHRSKEFLPSITMGMKRSASTGSW